jgi:HEAT repeat protein
MDALNARAARGPRPSKEVVTGVLVRALVIGLTSSRAGVRRQAARGLARVGSVPGSAVAALTALAAGDRDEEVRREAARALQSLGCGAAPAGGERG